MNILGFKNIISDLRSLSFKMKSFIFGAFLLFITTTWLSTLNIGSGFDKDEGSLWWNILSMVSAFISIMNVILIANKKISNYFWGIISCVVYGIYAWHKGYVGDAVLNVFFYLPMTFVGYYLWKPKMENGSVLKRKWNWKHLLIILFSSGFIFMFWYFILPHIYTLKTYTNNENITFKDEDYGKYIKDGVLKGDAWTGRWMHILDAATNTLGVVSTGLMYARIPLENVCYLISNPMSITMWSILGGNNIDINMILNYSFFFIVAVIGFVKWYDLKIINENVRRKIFKLCIKRRRMNNE